MANTKATFFIEKLDKRALEALFRAKRRLTFGKKSIRNRSFDLSKRSISNGSHGRVFTMWASSVFLFKQTMHFFNK